MLVLLWYNIGYGWVYKKCEMALEKNSYLIKRQCILQKYYLPQISILDFRIDVIYHCAVK